MIFEGARREATEAITHAMRTGDESRLANLTEFQLDELNELPEGWIQTIIITYMMQIQDTSTKSAPAQVNEAWQEFRRLKTLANELADH